MWIFIIYECMIVYMCDNVVVCVCMCLCMCEGTIGMYSCVYVYATLLTVKIS